MGFLTQTMLIPAGFNDIYGAHLLLHIKHDSEQIIHIDIIYANINIIDLIYQVRGDILVP